MTMTIDFSIGELANYKTKLLIVLSSEDKINSNPKL